MLPVKNWPTLKSVSARGVAIGAPIEPHEIPPLTELAPHVPRMAVYSVSRSLVAQAVTPQFGTMPLETNEPPSLACNPVLAAGWVSALTLFTSYVVIPTRTACGFPTIEPTKSVTALRAMRNFGGKKFSQFPLNRM